MRLSVHLAGSSKGPGSGFGEEVGEEPRGVLEGGRFETEARGEREGGRFEGVFSGLVADGRVLDLVEDLVLGCETGEEVAKFLEGGVFRLREEPLRVVSREVSYGKPYRSHSSQLPVGDNFPSSLPLMSQRIQR